MDDQPVLASHPDVDRHDYAIGKKTNFAVALLANLGALIPVRFSCLSGGGPPLGWPRIMTASPDKTYTTDVLLQLSHTAQPRKINFLNLA